MNVQEIAQAVADNAKSGKWLSCTFQLDCPGAVGGTVAVGIKAFGKWVQRVECAGLVDGVPEQKTLKALKEQTADLITAMVASLGIPQEEPRTCSKVHIDTVRVGDTVEVNGVLKTVCPGDIKSGFMGTTLFGDSYRLGTVPVIKADLIPATGKDV